MKLSEFVPKEIMLEFEDFSDLASLTLNNPEQDDLSKQNNSNRYDKSRKPLISLRHIHKLKLIQAAKQIEMEERKKLMGLMYSVPNDEESV